MEDGGAAEVTEAAAEQAARADDGKRARVLIVDELRKRHGGTQASTRPPVHPSTCPPVYPSTHPPHPHHPSYRWSWPCAGWLDWLDWLE